MQRERTIQKLRLANGKLQEAQIKLNEAVFEAKEAGHSWAEIAAVFGTSREAAYQRFAAYLTSERTRQ